MNWLSETSLAQWYRSRSWLGRRVILVALALVVAWVITLIAVALLLKYEVTDHREVMVGALLASIGELLFFSIVGGIVSVVTLKDPAQASFDERVKILFGTDRLPDPVMTYNKREISRLAGYACRAEREVQLEEYRDDIEAYRAKTTTTYYYRNLLPDVDYDEKLPWHYTPDKIEAQPPIMLAQLRSICIDGDQILDEPITINESGFRTELRLKIPRNGATTVVFEYVCWMRVGEQQTLNPRRLVEQFTMSIENRFQKKPIPMVLEGRRESNLLLFNEKYRFEPVQSIAPGEKIFSYVLQPPQ